MFFKKVRRKRSEGIPPHVSVALEVLPMVSARSILGGEGWKVEEYASKQNERLMETAADVLIKFMMYPEAHAPIENIPKKDDDEEENEFVGVE